MNLKTKWKWLALVVVTLLLAISISCKSANAGAYVENLPQNQLLHDGNLHIFLLGTGNPEAQMQNIRKPACLAVIVDGELMFFDAGEACVQTAAGLGLPYDHLTKVFMTHWHSDHFGGLGQLLNASWLHGRKQAVRVFGPYGTMQVVEGLNKAYELDTIFRTATLPDALDPNFAAAIPHTVDATASGTLVYSGPNLEISCFTVKHSPVVPAFGYVIKYHGAKIVISGDTTVVKSLEDQSKDADLLISESFSHALATKDMTGTLATHVIEKLSTYHADTLELAKMAERAGVKRLVLTHLMPAISTTDEAKGEFTQGMPDLYKGNLRVADDGDHIIVKPGTGDAFAIEYIPQKQPQIPVFPRPKDEAPTG